MANSDKDKNAKESVLTTIHDAAIERLRTDLGPTPQPNPQGIVNANPRRQLQAVPVTQMNSQSSGRQEQDRNVPVNPQKRTIERDIPEIARIRLNRGNVAANQIETAIQRLQYTPTQPVRPVLVESSNPPNPQNPTRVTVNAPGSNTANTAREAEESGAAAGVAAGATATSVLKGIFEKLIKRGE